MKKTDLKVLFFLIVIFITFLSAKYFYNEYMHQKQKEVASYQHVDEFYRTELNKNIILDGLVLLFFTSIIYIVYRKMEHFNAELQQEVDRKTKEMQETLIDLETYKQVIDSNSIVTKSDPKGFITYVNDQFVKVAGFTKEEALGKPHSIIRHPDMSKDAFADLWQTIQNKKLWKGIVKNRKKNGGYYYVDTSISPILDSEGNIKEYIAIRHDITELINKKRDMEALLKTDTLTGLGNRNKLIEDIYELPKSIVALIDIDHFGNINDFYGNDIGDLVLKEFGTKIKSLLSEHQQLYRYNSDQFVILDSNVDKIAFEKFIYSLLKNITDTIFTIRQKEISLQATASISAESKEEILQSADMALNEAKKNKKHLLLYDKSLELEMVYQENIEWSAKIKRALIEDRIIAFYQPIYNNKTHKIEKYECLIRMIGEDGTIISPYKFLDISKKSKQYIELTKRVIDKAFTTFKESEYQFSINITIEDILSEELNNYISEKLQDKNISGRIVFELVESEGIENLGKVSEFITKAKDAGSTIAIDDFGTGYSNFEYLIKLNADYIKIDGSMIKNIDTNKNHEEIVKTIVDFARKMNLQTIAEFVGSKDVFDKVVELGIDYSQGYYISEPKEKI